MMRIVSFLALIILVSCNRVEQVTNHYTTYQEAQADKFFDHGWIPEEAIYPSMTNIFNRSHIDYSTCIFSYELEETELEDLRKKIFATEAFIEMPRGIRQPKEWVDVLTNAQNYVLKSGDEIIYIAIENNGNTVLGWRN